MSKLRLPPKPYGTTCRLFYDVYEDAPPEPGNVIRTRAGSCYFIQSARKVNSRRYPNRNRYQLVCVRLDPKELKGSNARILPLYWYPRNKKKR